MSKVYISADQGATWLGEDYFGMILQPGNENDMTPPVEDVIVNMPGMVGGVRFPSRVGSRPIKLPMAFPYETTQRDMQARARAFAAFLFDGYGFPRDLWLRFDYDPDKFYTVRFSGAPGLIRDLSLGFAQVPFTAADPRKQLVHNAGDITLDSYLMLDSDYRLDEVYSHSITGNKTVEVNNFGGLVVGTVIQITGSFTTLSISIGTKTLVYGQSLAAGTLTIDCAKFTARQGIVNKNTAVSGSWLELMPGINNVTFTGTGMNFTAGFIFRPKFI